MDCQNLAMYDMILNSWKIDRQRFLKIFFTR